LLAMMRLTELTTFIAHAPTSDTAGGFFSASMAPAPAPPPSSTQPHANPGGGGGGGGGSDGLLLVSSRLGCLTREGPLGYKARGRCRLGKEGSNGEREAFELGAGNVNGRGGRQGRAAVKRARGVMRRRRRRRRIDAGGDGRCGDDKGAGGPRLGCVPGSGGWGRAALHGAFPLQLPTLLLVTGAAAGFFSSLDLSTDTGVTSCGVYLL
jgi:hypothetical protein